MNLKEIKISMKRKNNITYLISGYVNFWKLFQVHAIPENNKQEYIVLDIKKSFFETIFKTFLIQSF